ncbi:hypothetical protein D9M68_678600 [compost metagenome]
MQFPAHQVGVDVARRDDFGRLVVVTQLVGVVRDVHLLLADQLEVVPVHCAVEHEGIVVGRASRCARIGRVVRKIRRQLDPALPRQVLPAATRLLQRVDRVLQQNRFTGTAGRPGVLQLDLVEDLARRNRTGWALRRIQRVFDEEGAGSAQRSHTGRVDVPGVVLVTHAYPLIAQEVVPHGFVAIARNRERHPWQRVLQRQTAFAGLRAHGVLRRVLQHALRHGHGTVGRVHVHTVGRVALEQLLGRGGQLAGVLGGILAIDH